MYSFDPVELEGPTCGLGHPYVYPPAIEAGRFTTSECEPCGEEGATIDDFTLRCGLCGLFVSRSFGACPNDPGHPLTERDD